jgi:uncharacterized surface protein with fasciclin (FAS1) repeats
MKRNSWRLILAIAVMLALPFSLGSAQDIEDPIEEPIEEYEPGYDVDTLLPIITILSEYGSLETFLELIKEAGLLEELEGDGPVTVFVPDDSAFVQLQPAQLERLMSDRKFLKEVLSRHIVAGHRVEFGDGPETLTVKALNGDVINIEVTEESVKIERGWIIDEQIECSNGLVHVIDAVLLPPKGARKG